jgi:hypothetical protein
MDIANKYMRLVLNKLTRKHGVTRNLINILDAAFIEYKGGIFFAAFWSDGLRFSLDNNSYFDLSGLEFTSNKFHIEDYSTPLVYEDSLAFLDAFTDKWRSSFSEIKCVACVSFQDDAPSFGKICTFTFYLDREDEVVIDINNLDSYNQPMMVRVIG